MISGTSKRKLSTSFPGRGNSVNQISRATVMSVQLKAVKHLSYLHGHCSLCRTFCPQLYTENLIIDIILMNAQWRIQ